MTDIQTKYQILAAEYAKLKEQVQILKHAVRNEQAKEEELKGSLQEKERSLRKTEQELESLVFRNKQLSSRVEVLQRELDTAASAAKNKKHKFLGGSHQNSHPSPSSNSNFDTSVISEELHKKIEENASLHKEVFESKQLHRNEVGELEEKLMRLEEEAGRHEQVLSSLTSKNNEAIEKLMEEKALLQAKLHNQQTDTADAQQRAQKAEETLEAIESDLRGRLDAAQETIQMKLPFNDAADKSLVSLNVPSHNRRHQQQSKELVGKAATLIKPLTQALSNFYTYSEQRAAAYPNDAQTETLSEVNKKLCQHLHNNAGPLRQVEQSLQQFTDSLNDDIVTTLETAVGLQVFATAWNHFVSYASKLLPYQLLSLIEECRVSSCTDSLEKKNMDLHAGLQAFVAALTKLDTYITLLAKYSDASGCELPKASQSNIFQLLCAALQQFHTATKELSHQFNAKISIEHQLPTSSKKLKITDECIVSALINMSTCTQKFASFFTENMDFLREAVKTSSQPCHPAVGTFHQRAAAYMTSLTRSPADSVPHQIAVHNRQTLYSSTESQDSLTAQVVGLQENSQRLEKEREHWMLEAQLQQVKFDMQGKRMTDLEKQVKLLQDRLAGVALDHTFNDKGDINQIQKIEEVVRQHSIEGGCSREEQDVREKLIKEYYRQRIDHLIVQLQMGDSKALHFEAECRALHKRLALANKERNISDANQEILQLKDELATTKRNYEQQLSMMSEHLAGMNEKLTSQTDEINALKYQLNQKGDKKSKRK